MISEFGIDALRQRPSSPASETPTRRCTIRGTGLSKPLLLKTLSEDQGVQVLPGLFDRRGRFSAGTAQEARGRGAEICELQDPTPGQ